MKEQTINSLEFAQESHEIHGTIAPRDLVRLKDVLFATDGELKYRLQGKANSSSAPEISMQIQGELQLICQRCMGPLNYTIDTVTRFVIVADEDKIPAPEHDQDDVDRGISGISGDTILNSRPK